MRKKLFLFCGAILIIACFTSCMAHTPEVIRPNFEPVDLNAKLKAGDYRQKANNFVVILDASRSAGDVNGNRTDFWRSKEFIYRMNQTIPDITLNAALRSFGRRPITSSDQTILHFGPGIWSRSDFQAAVDTVPGAADGSPVEREFSYSDRDMTSMSGHTAVILVGDGEYKGIFSLGAAKLMKARYGDNVCIYTVLASRETPDKAAIMKEIAEVGECGFYQSGMNLESSQAVAEWVAAVFLQKTEGPVDSDGDGVIDILDHCRYTPKGVVVDSSGCPLDSDGDGVPNYLDECPDTQKSARVGYKGCPLDSDNDGVYDYLDQCPNTPMDANADIRGCWVIKGVNFDTANWNIKSASYRHLNEVAKILTKNPDIKVEIQGHTDNRGAAKYNMMLSDKRANAVMEYLVEHGISPDRLTAVGYGFEIPAVSNATPEGRAQNRRVELKPIK
jgi:OOP family OmpA-OmpF porin